MANPTPLRVPLIETQAMSEFGDLREVAAYHDPSGMDRDHSYVPGFSEMKRTAAVEMAEVRRGLRAPKDVTALPVNLRWARSQNVQGVPDNSKQFGHGKKGYRLANQKDVGQSWLKEIPPGCTVGADGTIRNGDTVLMVCSQQDAAKNELAKRRATEERVKGAEGAFAQIIRTAQGINAGAAPYTKSESAEKPKK